MKYLFKTVLFFPQQESTTFRVNDFQGSKKQIQKDLEEIGVKLTKTYSRNGNDLAIKEFSEDYDESHEQIKQLLSLLGVPPYIYKGYNYHNDRVIFESIDFHGEQVILTNFFGASIATPLWAYGACKGEITNYGDHIYGIKLPKFQHKEKFIFQVNPSEYYLFGGGEYQTVDFDNGRFSLMLEFPPIFIIKGLNNALTFFERLLEINFDQQVDCLECLFPSERHIQTFFL